MRTTLLASPARLLLLCALAGASLVACSNDPLAPGGPQDLATGRDLLAPHDGPVDLSQADLTPLPDLTPVPDIAGGGVGTVCGGFAGRQCAAVLFCEFSSDCGAADEPGFCQARPEVCSAVVNPVCGCDGKAYINDCERQKGGTSLFNKGACGCGHCGAGGYCAQCKNGPACLPLGQVC